MSLHPMRSLKSSIVSKSTSFHPNPAAGEGVDIHSEHPCSALRSSWISRLRTAPSPTAAENYPSGKGTTESNESGIPSSSFIVRRYLGFVPRPPPPPPQIPGADDEVQVVASFGPFQVRCYQQGERVKFEEEVKGRKLGFLERKLQNEAIGDPPSPLVLQFSPQMNRIAAGVPGCTIEADPFSSSGFHNFFRLWKVEDKLQYGVYKVHSPCPWPASYSRQQAARGRGAAAGDLSNVASTSRNFLEIHTLHNHAIPRQPEESFSSWNMGRFRRANLVSSVSSSFDLAGNFGRKRRPYADNVSYKHKRMASEKQYLCSETVQSSWEGTEDSDLACQILPSKNGMNNIHRFINLGNKSSFSVEDVD